jgi:thiol-disulfide isomerase/thioredoxin
MLAGVLILVITHPVLNVFSQTPPPNDQFSNAIQLTGANVLVTGSNAGATKEPGEPDHAGNPGGKSVWWYWQAPQSGYVTISTGGSVSDLYGGPLDTVLGVYVGLSVSNLTEIASNDDGPTDLTSLVSFQVTAGTVYRIAVDGYSYATPADADYGAIVLSLIWSATPAIPPPPPPLTPAPGWSLPGIDGATINSADFTNKVIALNFWATWCPPCVAEIPDLIALQQKYAPDGLVVIGISVDYSPDGVNPPAALVGSFAAGHQMNYPIVMSRPGGAAVETAYGGIPYIPNTFIIDRQNRITQSFVGNQSYATFESSVLPLLYANLAVNMAVSNGQARIYWPITQATFVLESASDLSSGAWSPVTTPVQSDGSGQFVNLPLGGTSRFFRLRNQ